MVTSMWMYDIIIYLYALSLLFYYSDYMNLNRNVKRLGTGLLSFVWILQTVFFISRAIDVSYWPVFSLFESLFFFSWLMVSAALALHRFFYSETLTFFIHIIAFTILTLNMFNNPYVQPTLQTWEMVDELLFVHISLAIGSYAAFTVSVIFTCVYLYLHRRLKKKKWSQSVSRLPSLEKLDSYSILYMGIGIPLLLLSLCLGLIWIVLSGEASILLDMKVFSSFAILAVYVLFGFWRRNNKFKTVRAAKLNLIVYCLIWINFFLSNFLSDFHKWIWM